MNWVVIGSEMFGVLKLFVKGLRLVSVDDGLKHRPRADWSIVFLNCELQEAEVWLQSALGNYFPRKLYQFGSLVNLIQGMVKDFKKNTVPFDF